MKYANVIIVIVILLLCGGGFTLFVHKASHDQANTECINNLRLIGSCLNSYKDSVQRFPSATASKNWCRDPNAPEVNAEKRVSWIYEISGFVESRMDPKWRIDCDKAWDTEENRYVAESGIGFFLCPSRPSAAEGAIYQLTSYVGISGLGKDAIHLPRTDPAAGIFGFDRGVTLGEIKDGASTTMAVAETARDNGPWAKPGYATVRGLDQEAADYLGAPGQFSSHHYEGTFSKLYRTNVAMVDGSVKSLSEKLSPRIFEALSTISGDEKIDPLAVDQ
jgi:uncharacterized protein DUF1559